MTHFYGGKTCGVSWRTACWFAFWRSNTASLRYWSNIPNRPWSTSHVHRLRSRSREMNEGGRSSFANVPTQSASWLCLVFLSVQHTCVRRTLSRSLLLLPRSGLVRVTSLSHLTPLPLHYAAITIDMVITCVFRIEDDTANIANHISLRDYFCGLLTRIKWFWGLNFLTGNNKFIIWLFKSIFQYQSIFIISYLYYIAYH